MSDPTLLIGKNFVTDEHMISERLAEAEDRAEAFNLSARSERHVTSRVAFRSCTAT